MNKKLMVQVNEHTLTYKNYIYIMNNTNATAFK